MIETAASLEAVAANYKTINTGFVGKTKGGDLRGCYVMVTINNTGNRTVAFIRLDYDVEKAAKAAIDSPLSGDYAEALRKAN